MGRLSKACAGLVLALAAFVAAATPVAGAGPKNAYIVVLKDAAADVPAVAQEHARKYGVKPSLLYQSSVRGYAAQLPSGALGALRKDSRVASVEADQIVRTTGVPTGVQRIFATANSALDLDGADDSRVDVDVAVIDTGIDFDHPDLNVVGRTDCVGKTTCTNDAGDDGNGHGTHVAGTIGALDNATGVVGVAAGARLWAVRVLGDDGSGMMSSIIAGIDWVTARSSQIEIANMSLGCECTSDALNRAIAASVAKGVVFVVAAGNSGKDASAYSPANHPDVITVSALADFDGRAGGSGSPTCRADVDDTLADFSNRGSLVELAAPGVCIESTWRDGGYGVISGTSMASPHVAGAAALLASKSNPATAADVQSIRATLVARGNAGWTDESGDGVREPLLDVSDPAVFAPAFVSLGGITPPPPPALTLRVTGYKVKGQQKADLAWSGATTTAVDVFRNGVKLVTTANDGAHTDPINRTGKGTYLYKLCEAASTTCSNEVTVTFG